MFDTFFGLPLHPLVVHATEVIVPLAAVLVILTAAWPRFRRWAGYLTLGICLLALALVPLSTQSGEKLEARVGENALIETHAELADGLLPWVGGLVLIAAALLWWNIREKRAQAAAVRAPDSAVAPRPEVKGRMRWIPATLLVLALVVSGGTTVQAILIGHSGATAVWSGDMEN
ncbi:hypothetical protein D8Y23_09175 [Microbacterium enclense]|jgi:hypothetical protein|uniref:DUF2231 domain-containing protein n=1 Tax=Microbacterium enclense TaxID=993073 RepID=A0A3S3L8C0_9MICO|nr:MULTISPECIES: DUF2231 domain-containing protein [Microbacterium]MBT9608267.1 hypothetical protein [Microbacterium sp.]RWR18678.1 hypothetical protein D8Y23_09175 [Microbacterium enclense]